MCERLCDADGPDVCTEGSKLIRGICTNYYFQSDVLGAEYCYKSKLTRHKKCRVTEYPVRVTDVPRLLTWNHYLQRRQIVTSEDYMRELGAELVAPEEPRQVIQITPVQKMIAVESSTDAWTQTAGELLAETESANDQPVPEQHPVLEQQPANEAIPVQEESLAVAPVTVALETPAEPVVTEPEDFYAPRGYSVTPTADPSDESVDMDPEFQLAVVDSLRMQAELNKSESFEPPVKSEEDHSVQKDKKEVNVELTRSEDETVVPDFAPPGSSRSYSVDPTEVLPVQPPKPKPVFKTIPVTDKDQVSSETESLAVQEIGNAILMSFFASDCHSIKTVGMFVDRFVNSRNIPEDVPSVDLWKSVKGHMLLEVVKSLKCQDDYQLIPVLMLAANMYIPEQQVDEFIVESGVGDFCEKFADRIGTAIHKNNKKGIFREGLSLLTLTYTARLPSICPQAIDSPDLKRLVVQHRIARIEGFDRNRRPMYDIADSVNLERNQIFSQSLELIASSDGLDRRMNPSRDIHYARNGMKVFFVDEPGYGYLNNFSSWFEEMAKYIFNPKSGYFQVHGATKPHYSRMAPWVHFFMEERREYIAIGRLLAMSIIHGHPLKVVLPVALYARILKREVTLADISEDEPDLVESLKSQPADVVRARLDQLIPKGHASWIHALHQGFSQALPLTVLEDVMSLKDIQSVIHGDPEPDLHDFIKHVKLEGYTADSVQIQFLWRMMEHFRSVRLLGFYRFVTGMKYVPYGGLTSLRVPIKIVPTDEPVPRADTEHHRFYLPKYDTYEKLEAAVMHAISQP